MVTVAPFRKVTPLKIKRQADGCSKLGALLQNLFAVAFRQSWEAMPVKAIAACDV